MPTRAATSARIADGIAGGLEQRDRVGARRHARAQHAIERGREAVELGEVAAQEPIVELCRDVEIVRGRDHEIAFGEVGEHRDDDRHAHGGVRAAERLVDD